MVGDDVVQLAGDPLAFFQDAVSASCRCSCSARACRVERRSRTRKPSAIGIIAGSAIAAVRGSIAAAPKTVTPAAVIVRRFPPRTATAYRHST